MDDRTLLAVCIADEAGNQPYEGKVAIGRVVLNRARLRFMSDGTIPGTILHPLQFSGFWFDFIDGHYTRVARTLADAATRAEVKRAHYSTQPVWADCINAADASLHPVPGWGGPEYRKLTDRTVNYYAPSAVLTPPAWARPDLLDAVIYAHHFYHAEGI